MLRRLRSFDRNSNHPKGLLLTFKAFCNLFPMRHMCDAWFYSSGKIWSWFSLLNPSTSRITNSPAEIPQKENSLSMVGDPAEATEVPPFRRGGWTNDVGVGWFFPRRKHTPVVTAFYCRKSHGSDTFGGSRFCLCSDTCR